MNIKETSYEEISREFGKNDRLYCTLPIEVVQYNFKEVLLPLYRWIISMQAIGKRQTFDIEVERKSNNPEEKEIIIVLDNIDFDVPPIIIPSYVRNIAIDKFWARTDVRIVFQGSNSYTDNAYYNRALLKNLFNGRVVNNIQVCTTLENFYLNTLEYINKAANKRPESGRLYSIIENYNLIEIIDLLEIHTNLLRITKGSRKTLTSTLLIPPSLKNIDLSFSKEYKNIIVQNIDSLIIDKTTYESLLNIIETDIITVSRQLYIKLYSRALYIIKTDIKKLEKINKETRNNLEKQIILVTQSHIIDSIRYKLCLIWLVNCLRKHTRELNYNIDTQEAEKLEKTIDKLYSTVHPYMNTKELLELLNILNKQIHIITKLETQTCAI